MLQWWQFHHNLKKTTKHGTEGSTFLPNGLGKSLVHTVANCDWPQSDNVQLTSPLPSGMPQVVAPSLKWQLKKAKKMGGGDQSAWL